MRGTAHGTRGHGSRLRALAAALLAGAALALSPGVASAAPGRSAPPDVVPLVDCITRHADGTWTAVFGYDNRTGRDVDIPLGPANRVTPKAFDGQQPTHFGAGVRHGVMVVTVDRGGGPMWRLGSSSLAARTSDEECSSPIDMPADGNGTGGVIVLAAAGITAALLAGRAGLRARRSA